MNAYRPNILYAEKTALLSKTASAVFQLRLSFSCARAPLPLTEFERAFANLEIKWGMLAVLSAPMHVTKNSDFRHLGKSHRGDHRRSHHAVLLALSGGREGDR